MAMRKIKIAVGRHGNPGAPLVQQKKMESRNRQEERAEKRRIQGDFDRKARWAQEDSDRRARRRDWLLGTEPKPRWAEARVCHLDIDTKTGACGKGEVQDAGGMLYNEYGACFQSKFIRWVNCEECLVRFDWWLQKGQIEIGVAIKKKRPIACIIKPLESSPEWAQEKSKLPVDI